MPRVHETDYKTRTQHPFTLQLVQETGFRLSFIALSDMSVRTSRFAQLLVTPITRCKHLFRPPRTVRACIHDLLAMHDGVSDAIPGSRNVNLEETILLCSDPASLRARVASCPAALNRLI